MQGELDFSRGDADGYARWRQEQENLLARLRKELGLPVGRNVRLKLRDLDQEFCGRLSLAELPVGHRKAHQYLFRLGNYEFAAAEIEYCVRQD